MSAPTQTSASVKQPEKCAKTYRLSPYQPSIQSTHNESIAPSKTNPSIASGGVIVTQQPSVVRAFIDSFRQNDIQKNATRSGSRRAGRRPNNGNHRGDERQYDVESAVEATAMSPLARKLNGRHLQMIAIGGSIGTWSVLTFGTNRGQDLTRPHLHLHRNRSLRRLRRGAGPRRSSLSSDCILSHRNYDVLHRPSAR